MSDRTNWQAEWRALAEKELRGAPLSSLTPSRPDQLRIEPALGPDDAREQGIGDAPRARLAVTIASRVEDLALAADVDGVWWRAHEAPPQDARVLIVETPGDPALVEAVAAGDASASRQSVVALTDVQERGGSYVSEVAVGVAALIELGRRRGGVPAQVRFAVAVGPELFVEIAKLRALRRLARRVLATLGLDSSVWIAARSSARSLSRLDVATNAIRSTLAASAAMIGGADVVGVLPMDALADTGTPLAARLARNTPVILARESSLTAVDDPARGSFEIEALTDGIARDAWEVVREIERAGGLVAARSYVRARIDRDADTRRAAIRSRRLPLVGVSKFAMASDRIAAIEEDDRDGSPFELARSAPRVPVELVVVGVRDAIAARVDFVRELLEVGGFDIAPSGTARLAVVCAPDAAFESEVPKVALDLRARGVAVFVAGRPGAAEPALRHAGVTGFVALGQDVTVFFAALRDALSGGAS
jgi:methylmalonyl-CoA mutase